ncbi:23S rRNA (pseudouridine(1915)-N(3))-methyltransferase RlmH [Silvanigrella sp.]|jgi:23S rRNA (pseudouridine1915-N3)-methyltransferase|uniref:23S rRNA (pseudouridine(1915)-N(3))-methyltransferase RlmH n=1 Tax=Silvanigrella sp. TaxID=2024976 RepID=UPI0037C57766|nr:23S rRNA (pseudouridine(1915)-N(3))-methyltransferase RlmH [Silvanigrellaceae bacterium]
MRYVFITPWKIPQQSYLYDFVNEFQSRISKFTSITHIYPTSPINQNELYAFYAKEFKKLSVENPLCIAFDENGKNSSSAEFAKSLDQYESRGEKMIIFCLGGAYGLPAELKSLGRIQLISLSQMTFPHELAFAVLLEQVYRARCILSNHPYHHGEISSLAKSHFIKNKS